MAIPKLNVVNSNVWSVFSFLLIDVKSRQWQMNRIKLTSGVHNSCETKGVEIFPA
jgi:hypothetical protein